MSEDKAEGPGYAKLEKSKNDPRGETFSELCLPEDNYNFVYISFVFGGIGFLIPYNSFIMATDYFKTRFPENPVVFDVSLIYIMTAFITVLGNNLLVDVFSMNTRIKFEKQQIKLQSVDGIYTPVGEEEMVQVVWCLLPLIFSSYVVSFITLAFVGTFEIYSDMALKISTIYIIHLIAIAIAAIGCTIQQSSFYGYTSMMPPKYIHAVMVGESIAGVFTSVTRITTRFFISDVRLSTVIFFLISFILLTFCCFLYPRIRKSDFVQFYISLCERSKTKITLEPKEDAGLIEVCEYRYGVLKIQTSPPASSHIMSFANPVYEPTGQGSTPTYHVEDVLFAGRRRNSQSNKLQLGGFKEGLRVRGRVARQIFPYMLTIFLVYFTTLCLYPGIASEVESCHMGYWMPLLMMIDFNCADSIGKMVATTHHWPSSLLVRAAVARMGLIPLMVLCLLPVWHLGLFSNDILSFTYSILLGLSNGLLGSIPMIQAPTKVARCYRELAGNMMTIFYMWGLATGSLGAYALEKMIRPIKVHHDCDRYQRNDPYSSFNNTKEVTTLSSSSSILITTILSSLSTINTTEAM